MNERKEGQTTRFFRRLFPSRAKDNYRLKRVEAMPDVTPGSLGKILIVDDDQITLKTTSMKLEAEGYAVVTAADGSEAIKRVREEKPDLVLLDVMFPPDVAHGGGVPWDGFLLLRWLRTLEQSSKLPVLLITADAIRYRNRALASGAAGIFDKPLDFDRLLPMIQRIVQGNGLESRQEGNFQI